MFGLDYVWSYILVILYATNSSVRSIINAGATTAWNYARGTLYYAQSVYRRLLIVTALLLILAIIIAILGIFWLWQLKLLAIMILIVWLAFLVITLHAIAGAVSRAPNVTFAGIQLNFSSVGKALAEALHIGRRGILLAIAILACWGIQILAFPGIGSSIGLFVLMLIIARVAAKAYDGEKVKLKLVHFFITISIIAFVVSRFFPGANAAVDDFFQENSTALWNGMKGQSLKRGLKNEPSQKVQIDNYVKYWDVEEKDIPVFDKDWNLLAESARVALLNKINNDVIIVVNKKIKHIPETIKENYLDMEFALIKEKPRAGVANPGYIVPARMLNQKEKSAFRDEIEFEMWASSNGAWEAVDVPEGTWVTIEGPRTNGLFWGFNKAAQYQLGSFVQAPGNVQIIGVKLVNPYQKLGTNKKFKIKIGR